MPARLSLALGTLVLFVAPAFAQKDTSRISKEDLSAILEAARKKADVPALGAAVVTSSGLAELAVAGVRKRGDRSKVEETDLFHLGSDTKSMTAALAAVLVRKKLLSYDRTLGEAFHDLKGQMPEELRAVTLAQCLSHYGGLPANLAWEKIRRKGGVRSQREEAVRRLLTARRPAKPGEKFLYSNTGYVVAGAMAERAAEKSWEQLLQEHVAKPLGMTVGFGPVGVAGKLDQPRGHDEDGDPVEPTAAADNPPVLGPAGRAHCSLADWARFVADQLKGAKGKDGLLPAASYKALHTPRNKGERYTPGGWLYLPSPGGALLGHDGSNTFNFAAALLSPKEDVAVLVVCNQGGKKGQTATHEAREAILEKVRKR